MKARIIRIGNSRGVRISKALLEEARLGDEVEITVQGSRLVITSVTAPRAGWEETFQVMGAAGDDSLLDADDLGETAWDAQEWVW